MTSAFTGVRPPVPVDSELPPQTSLTENKALLSVNGSTIWGTIPQMIGKKRGQATGNQVAFALFPHQEVNPGKMLSTDGVGLQWISEVASPLYAEFDVSNFTNGVILPSEVIVRTIFVRTVTFSAGLPGSLSYCVMPSSFDAVFTIRKNSTPIGTMTFLADQYSAVFSTPSPVTFNRGDQLYIIGPADADYTLANLATTIIGNVG